VDIASRQYITVYSGQPAAGPRTRDQQLRPPHTSTHPGPVLSCCLKSGGRRRLIVAAWVHLGTAWPAWWPCSSGPSTVSGGRALARPWSVVRPVDAGPTAIYLCESMFARLTGRPVFMSRDSSDSPGRHVGGSLADSPLAQHAFSLLFCLLLRSVRLYEAHAHHCYAVINGRACWPTANWIGDTVYRPWFKLDRYFCETYWFSLIFSINERKGIVSK